MPRASPSLNAFNAGEWGMMLEGRSDLAKYPSACRLIENFLPTVQGPNVRRGGSRFVLPVKSENDRTWLVKFEYSPTVAYKLEFGHEYVRFYGQRGILESSPGVPYEIVSPYALADLTNDDGTCALSIEQRGDVLYIANATGTYLTRKLTRRAELNWVFTVYQPKQGPLLEQNIDGGIRIFASANAGSGVNLEADGGDVFEVTDVGRLIRLDVPNLDVHPWEVDEGYAIDDLVRFDGKTYKATTAGDSGTAAPIHEHGTAWDGHNGVKWLYMDSGYGIGRITAVTDSMHATCTVLTDVSTGLKQFPDAVVGSGNKTSRWQLGTWSDTTGYPRVVVYHKNRLWLFTKNRFAASVPDDYENMAGDFFGETRADNAIWGRLEAGDGVRWAKSLGKLLVVGTGAGEFVISKINENDPFGPGNTDAQLESSYRVSRVNPIVTGKSLVYAQRAGRKLLSFDYDVQSDGFPSQDLTALNDRITRPRIVSMAYQGEPTPILWNALSSGRLRGFTYQKSEDVRAWHRHPIGGNAAIESVITAPTPDGSSEELWFIARRTINGQTRRYVEFLERPWEGPDPFDAEADPGDDPADAFYVDSGVTYDGAPATTFTAPHLPNTTVQVLADGATHPDCLTDSGGQFTLARSASVVHAGFACPARIVTMRLEAGSADGTAQGKIKRIHKAVARFLESLGGKIGLLGKALKPLSRRAPSTPMGSPTPPSTFDDEITDFPGDYETKCQIEVLQDQPLPMTVAALFPRLKTYD